ncbi:kunitz-type trypsin inhibitor KTI2-like [Silene latifolia]|uniref:kunitz-type trypsin inhibitor KTI2-like n=1 Tax=Silene latifolia TaxID=37657 RepID=UPI003D76B994
MSSLLFQASLITLLLLPFLSFSTAYLVDIDNDPIINGKSYYIVLVTSKSSHLTYTQKKGMCPLYITSKQTENLPGTPVTISSPLRNLHITLNQRINLAFHGPTPCKKSLVWRQTLNPLARKVYITTGGVEGDPSFSITKMDRSLLPTYILKYWLPSDEDSSANVGLYENDGLLGLTEYPTTVSFKKAFNVIELSTS